MRLLIVTQAIDLDDPVLGFFHAWVAALARHVTHLEVVCLRLGRHTLPENVRVHSLGKEKLQSRFVYLARFGYYIWHLRHHYDRVLVHMNPEYVILGSLDWLVLGKRVAFWYNHPRADWRFRLAASLSHTVFFTSPFSAAAHLRHAKRMPAGIDTEVFRPQNVSRKPHTLYMQGRIMPSKHVDVALAALRMVRAKIPDVTLTLVGPENAAYGAKLRRDFADLITQGAVTFAGPKPNRETPALYSAHTLSLNLAGDGHYDKSVLESVLCGTPVVLASRAFASVLPAEWVTESRTPEALAAAIESLLTQNLASTLAAAQARITEQESLTVLSERLSRDLS